VEDLGGLKMSCYPFSFEKIWGMIKRIVLILVFFPFLLLVSLILEDGNPLLFIKGIWRNSELLTRSWADYKNSIGQILRVRKREKKQ
jgi:hypothetical protein